MLNKPASGNYGITIYYMIVKRQFIRLTVVFLLIIIFPECWAQTVDFRLRDLDNRERTFSELKGENLTVIDFWATWCRPCLRAIPELNNIYEKYKGKGVGIIGINCDGPRSVSKVIPLSRSLQIQYPVLMDMDATVMKRLNLSAFPTLVLAGGSGEILWIHEGFVPGDEELIREQIEKYLIR